MMPQLFFPMSQPKRSPNMLNRRLYLLPTFLMIVFLSGVFGLLGCAGHSSHTKVVDNLPTSDEENISNRSVLKNAENTGAYISIANPRIALSTSNDILRALYINPKIWNAIKSAPATDSIPLSPLFILQNMEHTDLIAGIYLVPNQLYTYKGNSIKQDSLVSRMFGCSKTKQSIDNIVERLQCQSDSWVNSMQTIDTKNTKLVVAYFAKRQQTVTNSIYTDEQTLTIDTSLLPKVDDYSLAQWNNTAGLILLGDSLFDAALMAFEAAQKLDPISDEYLLNRIACMQALDAVPGAILLLQESKDRVKQSSKLSGILGALYETQKAWENARLWAEHALSLEPNQPEWLINLSDALWQQGERLASKQVLYRKPEAARDFRFLTYMAGTHLGLEEYTDALLLLDLAKTRGNTTPLWHEYRMMALNGLGRYNEALMESGIGSVDSNSARYWFQKATAQFQLHQYRAAQQSLDISLSLDRTNNGAKTLEAQLLALEGLPSKNLLDGAMAPVAGFAPPSVSSLFSQSTEDLKNDPTELLRYTHLFIEKKKNWKKTTRIALVLPKGTEGASLPEWHIDFNPGWSQLSFAPLKIYPLKSIHSKPALISPQNIGTNEKTNAYVTRNHIASLHPDHLLAHLPLPMTSQAIVLEIEWTERSIHSTDELPFFEERPRSRFPILNHTLLVEGSRAQLALVVQGEIGVDSTSNPSQIRFTFPPQTAMHNEKFAPSHESYQAMVLGASKHTWGEVGDTYQHFLKSQGVNFDSVELPVLELWHELSRKPNYTSAPIQTIFAWVRDSLRFQNLEFSGRTLIPASPSKVLIDRYTDCKGHALLLLQLLKASGFKAHLALVQTEHQGFENLPTIHQWDHMMVYVETKTDTFYLDATQKFNAFRFASYLFEGKNTLILDPANVRIREIPMRSDSTEHHIHITRAIQDSAHTLNYQLQIELHGKIAADFREHITDWKSKGKQDILLSWLTSDSPELFDVHYTVHALDKIDSALFLSLSGKMPSNAWDVWSKQGLPILLEKSLLSYPSSKDRQLPVHFPFPIVIESQWKWGDDLQLSIHHQSRQAPYLSWQGTVGQATKKNSYVSTWSLQPFTASAEEWVELVGEWNRFWKAP